MRFFKAVDEAVVRELIVELQKSRSSWDQNLHEIKGIMHDLHQDLNALAKSQGEFVEVIRHFFAVERTLRDMEEKRRREELDNMKPGLHDDKF